VSIQHRGKLPNDELDLDRVYETGDEDELPTLFGASAGADLAMSPPSPFKHFIVRQSCHAFTSPAVKAMLPLHQAYHETQYKHQR